MKLPLLCLLALAAAVPAAAAPVHVSLKAAAEAPPNADGFITLGSVAGLTGGDKAVRSRFAAVLVARAPLPGEIRQLTRGDLALKLRQAGINPDTQAVLEGADQAEVTSDSPLTPILGSRKDRMPLPAVTGPASSETAATGPVIHNGDAVTIYIHSGPMTITAPATARENGKVGDTIRVHRDGVMTDLIVQVLDAQTVQMEI